MVQEIQLLNQLVTDLGVIHTMLELQACRTMSHKVMEAATITAKESAEGQALYAKVKVKVRSQRAYDIKELEIPETLKDAGMKQSP